MSLWDHSVDMNMSYQLSVDREGGKTLFFSPATRSE